MIEVSMFRLHLLRATYLLIVIGLGLVIWPLILQPSSGVSLMGSVLRSLLGAVSLLALFGLRYPLQMLPLLLFELVSKSIWMARNAHARRRPILAGDGRGSSAESTPPRRRSARRRVLPPPRPGPNHGHLAPSRFRIG